MAVTSALILASSLNAFEVTFVPNGLESDLRDTSLLPPLSKSEATVTGQDIIAAAQADYARLVGIMYDRGFFSPTVSIKIDGREAADLSPVQPMGRVRSVVVRTTTGPAFVFGKARISPTAPSAAQVEGYETGGPATTRLMQTVVEQNIDDWRSAGHAKAGLASQSITARHSESRLDVNIRLAPGPRLRFGKLNVDGTKRMRAARVSEIAGLPTGQVFDPEEVAQSAARLRRSGVFSSISLTEAEQISAGDTLDIDAALVEAKLRRFGFGAELSTQDGLTLSGFWLHRNLLGGGERFRVGGEVSGLGGETGGNDYELTLAFARPASFGSDTDFYLDGAISRVNEPNFKADRASLEGGLRYYASKTQEYTFGLGYLAAETSDIFGDRTYQILTLPVSAEFDYRDDELNAKSGYYAKADLMPFAAMRGTSSGVRGQLDLRAYKSVGENDGITFAARGQLGFVSGPSLANAPTDLLFYSGGSGTVRGQDYHTLGVDIGGGNVIGGKSFAGVSGEIRLKATDKLSVVGFYDVGYISASDVPGGATSDWHSGAGLGARYDTGIGPIRFDVASPLGQKVRARDLKIYIGIGQSF